MRPTVVYLGTRTLDLERSAELSAAQTFGADLVLVSPRSSDLQLVEAGLAKHVIVHPMAPTRQARGELATTLRDLRVSPTAVVAWSDSTVELAAHLAHTVGCRGTQPEHVDAVRNKRRTRALLDSIDSANPRWASVIDDRTLEAGLKTVGVPCLLKPAGSSGGRGIHRIAAGDDAEATYRAFVDYCDPDRDAVFGNYRGEAVLEQELQGSEHSVAGIVRGGVVHTLAIADKTRDRALMLTHFTIVPSRLPTAMQARVLDLVRRAVRRLGIDDCGFHADVMVTEDGPRILEVGGRLGGDCINSHLIPHAYGFDSYQALLGVVTGAPVDLPDPDQPLVALRSAAMQVLLPPAPGRVTSLHGLEQLEQHPSVRGVSVARRVGDEVVAPSRAYGRYALAYLVLGGEQAEDLQATAREIAAAVDCTVEATGNAVA